MHTQPKGTRLSRIGCWSAAIGLLLIAVSAGHKPGFIDSWQLAFGALALGGLAMLVALIAAGLGLVRSGGSAGAASRRATWLAFLTALLITGFNVSRISAMGGPPIHDISTDLGDPPAFVAAVPLREAAGATNPPAYFPEQSAALQAQAYPDIRTIVLDMPAEAAFARARTVATELGWELVEVAPDEGRIEAVATTPWIGFKDDVVIRVRVSGTQARVDLRSKSRVGRGDAGFNAQRIRAFRDRLASS
ncbi:MAG: hypothetical protein AMXMBFR8_27770 [Nevskiales bacterium]